MDFCRSRCDCKSGGMWRCQGSRCMLGGLSVAAEAFNRVFTPLNLFIWAWFEHTLVLILKHFMYCRTVNRQSKTCVVVRVWFVCLLICYCGFHDGRVNVGCQVKLVNFMTVADCSMYRTLERGPYPMSYLLWWMHLIGLPAICGWWKCLSFVWSVWSVFVMTVCQYWIVQQAPEPLTHRRLYVCKRFGIDRPRVWCYKHDKACLFPI